MALNFAKVEFVRSAANRSGFLRDGRPQFAFAGRSNVGKSSVINRLVGRKNLAYVGASPGKTTQINYFLVDQGAYLVDLPGYGYAKTGQQNRKTWSNFIREYLLKSENLRLICQLIDVRHTPMKSDFETFAWLAENDLPVLLVATKCDKLSRNELEKQARIITKAFGVERENLLCYSSVTHAGRADLLDVIHENLLQ